MLARMRRKRIFFALLLAMQAGEATLENSMEAPQKLKIELPYDPAIALLGIYPKDTKNADLKGHIHPNVYRSTINNSQIMERAQMSINC